MRTSRPIMGTVLLGCIMLLGPSPSAFAVSVSHDTDDTSRLKDTLHLENFTIPWLFLPPPVGLAHPDNGGTCEAIPADVDFINPVDKRTDRVREITREVRADGSQVIVQDDLKTGDAVDSHGNIYHFVYKNRAAFNVSPGLPAFVNVDMTDSFRLTGHGLHMRVSFHWRWRYTAPDGVDVFFDPLAVGSVAPFVPATIDGVNPAPGVTDWQQLSTQGDPVHCDPT
jgi:hypothetical protein